MDKMYDMFLNTPISDEEIEVSDNECYTDTDNENENEECCIEDDKESEDEKCCIETDEETDNENEGYEYEGFSSLDELLLNKYQILAKLNVLKQAGIELSEEFTMESSYGVMKYEYDRHIFLHKRNDGARYFKTILYALCTSFATINKYYKITDLDMNEFTENVIANAEYDDVLRELSEKYKQYEMKSAPPEIKLLCMIVSKFLTFYATSQLRSKAVNNAENIFERQELFKRLNLSYYQRVKQYIQALYKTCIAWLSNNMSLVNVILCFVLIFRIIF